ncbi:MULTISPECIES: sensor histidine kinase [Burkholderiaceae]|uniref:histidine kinase n=1 Tax=Caballeronia sordidicola TaxID=196367 RepID=A0A242MCR2_CABSO|nr:MULTISPECIES: HAMP domain-containing sensor histidine kinase [Burkholderiaceae]AME28126.1 hypothetical protein AXG89_30175 [Burkholderia sp. PAMC 26561]OTP69086.1 periplasmic sensor signal transduction histidine kinase [Caballeronia sordidicola]
MRPFSSSWLRSSVVRLLVSFLLLFIISTSLLFALVYLRSSQAMFVQADSILLWEARYFESFKDAELARQINYRITHQRLGNFYGLFNANGSRLAGNIAALPQGAASGQETRSFNEILSVEGRLDRPLSRMLVERLSDGGRLVIARDLGDVMQLRRSIMNTLLWGDLLALALCVGGGIALSIRQVRRVRSVVEIAGQIANGDLGKRFPDRNRDEIDVLSRVINQMLGRVEHLMGEVKSACDNIAHDLRSPLARARLALGRAADADAAHAREFVDQAIAETDITLARFSALLRISEIEARGRRDGFRTIDLKAVIDQVLEVLEPLLEEQQIALECELADTAMVNGDGELLFEAFYNVLDNAIKFSRPGDVIKLSLVVTPHGHAFCVRDHGVGIPESELSMIGRRFYRGASVAAIPGSGLGISLVMAVSRLHGFTVNVSRELPGTCVRMECWPHNE